MDKINVDWWEDCALEGCTNKRCLRLGSKYCFPHSMSSSTPEEIVGAEEKSKQTNYL